MKETMKALLNVQARLKAPKGQMNKFGGYKYRSCEDILEAVKPLLEENKLVLVLGDEIELIGDRWYVKATAKIIGEDGDVTNSAYAREAESKKGQDESQITGTASSYARKYALNGLFLIDDTKDADATNDHQKPKAAPRPKQAAKPKAAPQSQGGELKAAKVRLWRALQNYAAEHGGIADQLLEGVRKRPGAQMDDPEWLEDVASEFEAA
ncbi:ERF family protein [Slackia isoflavoniconvertens]|uniref:ERF family protein n=1 Tax=Slackia isoflavoniconvertens TaxID=572010 RepID=UPI003AB9643C